MYDDEIKKRAIDNIRRSAKKFTGNNNPMKRPEVIEKHKNNILESMKRPEVIKNRNYRDYKQRSLYLIVTYCGKEYIIRGINVFCKNNNLSQSKMSSVANNYRSHHKGIWCMKIRDFEYLYDVENVILSDDDIKINKKEKKYRIIDNNNNIFVIENMTIFCNKNGLSRSHMYNICNKNKTHKGYMCERIEDE